MHENMGAFLTLKAEQNNKASDEIFVYLKEVLVKVPKLDV
jgi:hypothetical protein